jgi:uncharacterized phiE125 gp8 family phage protein
MRPHYQLVTAPIDEPVSYDEASQHLRVDSTDDKDYILGLIGVAREYADSITGRSSALSTWKASAATWDDLFGIERDSFDFVRFQSGPVNAIKLFRTPLVSVSSVKYYAPDAGSMTTMSANDYRVITSTEPGQVQITGSLPAVEDRPDAIQITFVAGYSLPRQSPQGLRHAIKMIVANLYENRQPVAFSSCNEIPFTLQTLLENQKTGGWF